MRLDQPNFLMWNNCQIKENFPYGLLNVPSNVFGLRLYNELVPLTSEIEFFKVQYDSEHTISTMGVQFSMGNGLCYSTYHAYPCTLPHLYIS